MFSNISLDNIFLYRVNRYNLSEKHKYSSQAFAYFIMHIFKELYFLFD